VRAPSMPRTEGRPCQLRPLWFRFREDGSRSTAVSARGKGVEKIAAKKWGDTKIAERGRSVLVMHARYRSAGLTPHQRGWTDAG